MWDDSFDEKFRDAANEGIPSLDQSQMWNNISRDLDKQRTNRKFAWLWFFGALIFLISSSYFVTKNHVSFVNKNFESIAKEDINKSASTITKRNQPGESIDKIDKSSPSLNNQNIPSAIDSRTTTNSANENQKDINRTDRQLQQSITKPTALPPVTFDDSNMESSLEEHSAELTLDKDNKESEITLSKKVYEVAFLSSNDFGLLDYDDSEMLNQSVPIQVLPSQMNKWSVIVSTGALLYQKNLHTLNEELGSFVETKTDSERELYGVSASILADYKVNPGLSLRAGLNYISLYERFDYQFTENSEEMRFSENAYSYARSDGTVQTFGGDVPFQILNERRVGHTNQHNMLNLMMEASLSKQINKLKTEVKSGFSVTVAQSSNGKSLNTQLDVIEYNSKHSELYGLRNTSTYWHIGAGLEIPLSRRISFRSEMNYNVSLNPTNQSSDVYSQTYNMLGVNVGLKYQF